MKSASLKLSQGSKRLALRFGCVLAALTLPGLLSASFLNGSFGQGPLPGVDGIVAFQVGPTGFIDFCPEASSSPAVLGCTTLDTNPQTGQFTVTGSNIAGITGAATILDVASAANANHFTVFPVGPASPAINNFMSINGFDFMANDFEVATGCQVCIGGFGFNQVGKNVTVTVTFDGTVMNTDGSGNVSNWSDIITAQYTNTNIATVLAAATSPGGIQSNSWSGSVFVQGSATPEPGTIGLIGFSLVGLGVLARRKKKA